MNNSMTMEFHEMVGKHFMRDISGVHFDKHLVGLRHSKYDGWLFECYTTTTVVDGKQNASHIQYTDSLSAPAFLAHIEDGDWEELK